jgi:hypothetical protein
VEQRVVWSGVVFKKLSNSQYLISSDGILWKLQLASDRGLSGYVSIMGTIKRNFRFWDGLNEQEVPSVEGTIIDRYY